MTRKDDQRIGSEPVAAAGPDSTPQTGPSIASQTGPYRYQLAPDERVSETLVWLMDSVLDRNLGTTEDRLGDKIDPDALDALFPPNRVGDGTDASFRFEHWECEVTVTADRVILIDPNE